MPRVNSKQGVPDGQVKVTVRVTFPDKSDSWSQQMSLMGDAAESALRQCAALVAVYQQLSHRPTWEEIVNE